MSLSRDNYNHASNRMEAVQAPIIPVVSDLIRNTPGTISLGQGVVNYGPPQSAIEQIFSINDHPRNHIYGPVEGKPELIEQISSKLLDENGIITGNRLSVIVTAGANMGFLNTLFAITDPGDEIILPLPFYFNHEMAITMLSCRPVPVATDDNYQICLDKLQEKITKRTRAIVTISPNNPCGVVYPEDKLRQVNKLCREHGIYHISDEAYEYFTYDGSKHFSPSSIDNASAHTISLYSLSKSYGFASWRIGYMVVPTHLISAVKKVQDTNLICPSLVSQQAALGALKAGSNYCREKLSVIIEVRRQIMEELTSVQSLCNIPKPDGAFYVFLKINTHMNDMELVKRLIEEHRVAVIPGSTFGMQQGCYLRVAYAALEQETAVEGINRLTHGLGKILGT